MRRGICDPRPSKDSEINCTLGICDWRCCSGHGESLVGGTEEAGPCSGHSREPATCSKHFNDSWGLLNLTIRKQNAGSLRVHVWRCVTWKRLCLQKDVWICHLDCYGSQTVMLWTESMSWAGWAGPWLLCVHIARLIPACVCTCVHLCMCGGDGSHPAL